MKKMATILHALIVEKAILKVGASDHGNPEFFWLNVT